jgi:hypothetical protein
MHRFERAYVLELVIDYFHPKLQDGFPAGVGHPGMYDPAYDVDYPPMFRNENCLAPAACSHQNLLIDALCSCILLGPMPDMVVHASNVVANDAYSINCESGVKRGEQVVLPWLV